MIDTSFQTVASIVLAGLAVIFLITRYLYRKKRPSRCSACAAKLARKTMTGAQRGPSDS